MALDILNSGKAFEKFKEIIKAQEGTIKRLRFGKFKQNILNKKSGIIAEMDNKKINSLARTAGCPADKYSGLYLYYHVGDSVKSGDKLLTIYAESKSRLKEAVKFYKKEKPIIIK